MFQNLLAILLSCDIMQVCERQVRMFCYTRFLRTTKTPRVQNRKLRQERSFSVQNFLRLMSIAPNAHRRTLNLQKGTVPLVTLSWYSINFITMTL